METTLKLKKDLDEEGRYELQENGVVYSRCRTHVCGYYYGASAERLSQQAVTFH